MIVVKLGGSLLKHAELQGLLSQIQTQQYPILILPGGGEFADFVRAQQQELGFSDKTAHKMAIHAMQQYAELLQDISGLALFDVSKNTSLPAIFPPINLLSYAWGLPQDWSVTSDSLAIQLAIELQAKRCVLVKSCGLDPEHDQLDELSSQGVIDEYAPKLANRYGGELQVVSIQNLNMKVFSFL